MCRRTIVLWVAALSIALPACVQAAIPAGYQLYRLGPVPEHIGTNAYHINGLGQTIGASSLSGFLSGETTPTRWDFDQPSALPLPEPTYARASNAQAQVTGSYFPNGIGGVTQHAFTWNGSTFQDIHPAAGMSSFGLTMNDAGDVAGYYTTLNDGDKAFVWQNGELINLGSLGGPVSRAFSVNQAGVVVGGAETANQNLRAFRWEDLDASGTSDPGEMVQLDDLGLSSVAYGVNDADQIVGWVLNAQFQMTPALWNSPGDLTQLPLPAGRSWAEPLAINNGAQIVGTSEGRALIWSDGAVADLNSLVPQGSGWTLLRANSINDAGWIVGNGLFDGNDQAFLLVPVPEPNAAVLMVIGAACGGLVMRRQARRIGRCG